MTPVLPLWLKLAFTAWMLFWVPATVVIYGPQNFFWLCNLANFLILAALWLESRVLMSAQLLAVLLVGVMWLLDVSVAFFFGFHLIGGTEYMFDEQVALQVRLVSCYHAMLPVVAGYACSRLGYDPRGLWLQTGLTWLAIPITRLLTEPERNINWVYGPFNDVGAPFDPLIYLLLLMLLSPLVLYLPVHLAVKKGVRKRCLDKIDVSYLSQTFFSDSQ